VAAKCSDVGFALRFHGGYVCHGTAARILRPFVHTAAHESTATKHSALFAPFKCSIFLQYQGSDIVYRLRWGLSPTLFGVAVNPTHFLFSCRDVH
jgi:hypothetical protein